MSLRDNYIFDLDENVTRTPVSYKNRFGITIAADLYRPKEFDESREHAAVIVGAPYGGVKEQGPGIYAQNIALRGFVALGFDPSFNGYSGGEPRHLSSPDIFVEDFSAAVDYLGIRPFVDRERIGVIGMCGSGASASARHRSTGASRPSRRSSCTTITGSTPKASRTRSPTSSGSRSSTSAWSSATRTSSPTFRS